METADEKTVNKLIDKNKLESFIENNITKNIMEIPNLSLDGLVYTVQYCYTAQAIEDSLFGKKVSIDERYRTFPNMFENDLNSAPHVIKRLETFIQKLPEDSVTHKFAQKYLPSVKNFHELLKEYNNFKNK